MMENELDSKEKNVIIHQKAVLNQEDQELLEKAKEASKNAYSPFTGYKVGTALITEQGSIYTGCNVEHDPHSTAVCSERNAITTALTGEGKEMRIKKLAVIAFNAQGDIVLEGSSCGTCRQFMIQFGPEADIIYYYKDELKKRKIKELLPDPYIRSKK